MVKRIETVLVDDIDGNPAAETVTFALDGVSYEIDLTADNAAKLRADFAAWINAGRRVAGRKQAAKAALGGRARRRSNTDDLRAWARANGYDVKDRGRVPAEVVAAYEAAH